MPPQSGENPSRGIGNDIIRIRSHPAQEMWSDPLEKDRPHDEIKRNFPPGGHLVVQPKSEATLEPEQQRKRTGHQQQIVKVIVEEAMMNVRLDAPAIQGIKQTTHQEQAVAPITK